jgi:two-component system, chemotaxis family, sensor kinase CheA
MSYYIYNFTHEQIKEYLESFRERAFYELLNYYPTQVQNLAKKMDKSVEPFSIEGGDFKVKPQIYIPFVRSLTHVYRNIVDHAFDSEGKIATKVELDNKKIVITISDDGKGIDTEKLIQRAKEKNIDIPQNPLMLVFEDELSTKSNISEISGRGIGLSALKKELDILRADAKIISQKDVGTTFIFTLPLFGSVV